MKDYVLALEDAPDAERQRVLLDRIIAVPGVHARLLNTFSRMEYVGVRKLLKSRRSEALDLDGLQHMLDETIHAMRLKKAALALAGAAAGPGRRHLRGRQHPGAAMPARTTCRASMRAAEAALADLSEARGSR